MTTRDFGCNLSSGTLATRHLYKKHRRGSCIQLDTQTGEHRHRVFRVAFSDRETRAKILHSEMRLIILFAFLGACTAAPQYFAHPGTIIAHPAVLINSAIEDTLPNELRNDFYKNPRIAARLAKESWFVNKEMQVINRESDKIPREKIYSVLHNAGLARR